MLSQHAVMSAIKIIESFGIIIHEAGGEVWFERKKNLSKRQELELSMLSGVIQRNKSDFLDHIWKRDKFNQAQKDESKVIINRMIGNKAVL